MIPSEIHLQNWACFRGKQVLRLAAKAYSVSARREDDPEHSNYTGKSTLCNSFPFALFEWLDPGQGYKALDGFISRGEAEGGVKLIFGEDWVERKKERGRSVQLSACFDGVVHKQARAEEEIARRVGLKKADFMSLIHTSQGATSGLALATPGVFNEVVVGWLGIEPLARAADAASDEAARLEKKVERLDSAAAMSRQAATSVLGGKSIEEQEASVDALSRAAEGARACLAEAETAWARWNRSEALRASSAEYEALVEEGRALAAEVDATDHEVLEGALAAAERSLEAATGTWARAEEGRRQSLQLVRREFDGKCPLAGIQCPARAQINDDATRNDARYREAAEASARAEELKQGWRDERDEAETTLSAWAQKVRRLGDMRERAAVLQERVGESGALGEVEPAGLTPLRLEVDALQWKRADLSAQLGLARKHLRQAEEAEREAEPLRSRLKTAREAALLLDRDHAQRAVAEGALGQVERRANRWLGEAGVGLSMSVRWTREGGGLAMTCRACGAPFPKSARVKACEECGAARGPNLVHEAEMVVSARSGGALDLAGLAFRLSAARWLREERGSAWASCVLDEPTAQLDVAHRRALSRRLPQMLADAGFRQAFISSHSPQFSEGLPGKILITSDGKWSRAEVIA